MYWTETGALRGTGRLLLLCVKSCCSVRVGEAALYTFGYKALKPMRGAASSRVSGLRRKEKQNRAGAAMKQFHLVRLRDISGVSGTSHVAEGVVFSNGWCVLRWISGHPGLEFFQSIEDVEAVHGHRGKTKIWFLNGEGYK